MSHLSTGKIAEVMFETYLETYEQQPALLNKVNFHEPDGETMQNSSNVIWYPVEQHAPVISGWDLSNQETGIIEETYPAVLGTPSNDWVKQRADDVRTERFWKRRGRVSARRQAMYLNTEIASSIATQGSLFYRSNVTSGYEFIAEAQAMMNERQLMDNGRCFVLNDRDNLLYSKDLAGRQTLQGRPEDEAWEKGQIGANVAEFDVFTGSYLPNITGGADPAVTVTGNQSFAPSGGSVNATTRVVTNVDYREASVVVNNSALLSVGDKIQFENGGTPVYALGKGDKTNTTEPMTFTVIELTDATHIKIYPKPIAADDAALTTLEKAYANVNTTILNAATITRLNIDTTNKTNIFFDKMAVEVIGGTIPADKFGEFDGIKRMSETMSNGLRVYMLWDGDIATMTFRWRLFTWWGITVADPSNCGVAVSY
jgi:hypothetical protein